MLDGRNDPVKNSATDAADADDEAPLVAADEDKEEEKDAMDEQWHSVTEQAQPLTNDRFLLTVACSTVSTANAQLISIDRVGVGRMFESFCLSVCLSVSLSAA